MFSRRGVDEQKVYCFTQHIGHIEKRLGCWWFISNGSDSKVYNLMSSTRRALMEDLNALLTDPVIADA